MSGGIVGPILGPIATLPAGVGASGYDNREGLYTVAIGGLPFNVAPTDDVPYQRATAQFRKQQFDSAPTPGDQSLDGLWLRGQFSFHRGAGVKFFEALDGDATASRFQESEDVTPWTPGEVSLCPKLEAADATNTVDMATRYSTTVSDFVGFAITSGNAVRRVQSTGGTALTSGSATSVATNETETFVTAAAKVQRLVTGTTFTDLLTQGDGNTFVKVAWAKGRLFVVDTTGKWYAKPSAVATVAAADAFWNSGYTSAVGDWSVAESPSAVYLGRGRSIYAVLPEADGAVPVLEAPVVAATLPPGETVKALGHSLGWLVIVTDAGVRVAQSSETGALEMGPTLVDFVSSTCRQVGLWGNLAYVVGRGVDDTSDSVYVLDLTQVLAQNVVAYTKRADMADNSTGSGAAFIGGKLATFDSVSVRIESASVVEDSGTLTTGFVRFGTMEPKAFHSLRVKIDGDEGAVAISIVEIGGAETLLTSIAAARFADQEVKLNLPAPLETLGLKFTLTSGAGGTGPTLLGYQLRALPAPSRRTRMISVPLMCYDEEDAFNGVRQVGAAGFGFARLAALEAMEESSGVVLYQDFRTGEQAEVFIEEVAFTNKTAPKAGRPNFGGLVNVTLRKVS